MQHGTAHRQTARPRVPLGAGALSARTQADGLDRELRAESRSAASAEARRRGLLPADGSAEPPSGDEHDIAALQVRRACRYAFLVCGLAHARVRGRRP